MNQSIRDIIRCRIHLRGSQREAARIIGVAETTLSGWLCNYPSRSAVIGQGKIDHLCDYCGLIVETGIKITDVETGDVIYDYETGNKGDEATIQALQEENDVLLQAIQEQIKSNEIDDYYTLQKMKRVLGDYIEQ